MQFLSVGLIDLFADKKYRSYF